jgi:ActD protein
MENDTTEIGVGLYGLMAEFLEPHDLLRAAEAAHAAGYRRMDAYSPLPIEGLSHALGFQYTRLPLLVLAGGIVGGLLGYGLQYWINVIEYPYNIGGRPYHSWPAFIPVTFEMTILVASLVAVLGMLALNGLPMPYHPTFNVPEFNLASQNRFFLCIEARDPRFDFARTRDFLESLQPVKVTAVEW